MARILCILGLLLFVSCTVENKEIEEGIENLQLQQDGFALLRELNENLVSPLIFVILILPHLMYFQIVYFTLWL